MIFNNYYLFILLRLNKHKKHIIISLQVYRIKKIVYQKWGLHPLTLFILLVFFLIFCSISLVNHYFFRTASMDLGVNTHALHSFANFKSHDYTLWLNYDSNPDYNFFGDHFSPIIFLYIPFYYLFSSYTLLIIQIAAIIFGGIGIYKVATLKTDKELLKNLFVLHFFGIWGIYSALSFDFHNNVVGSMLIPWLFYYYEKRNLKGLIFIYGLVLLSKENLSLWLAFILMGLYLRDRFAYFKTKPIVLTILPLFALIYFFVIVSYVMPALSNTTGNFQMERYAELGKSPSEIINYILYHPRQTFALLFETNNTEVTFHGVKSEFYFMLLVSGGFLLFRKPYYLLMLIPVIAQKMFSDNVTLWGILWQYSIEFAPIISLGVIDVFTVSKNNKRPVFFALILLAVTWYFNIAAMNFKIAPNYYPLLTKFYNKHHYKSDWDTKEQHAILKTLPPDAVLSAHNQLVPHLSARERIYCYPVVMEADYIILHRIPISSYPLTEEDYKMNIEALENSALYKKLYDQNNILIFKWNKEKEKFWLQERMNFIRSDSTWTNSLKTRALKENTPFDTVLINETKYLLFLEYKKIGVK